MSALYRLLPDFGRDPSPAMRSTLPEWTPPAAFALPSGDLLDLDPPTEMGSFDFDLDSAPDLDLDLGSDPFAAPTPSFSLEPEEIEESAAESAAVAEAVAAALADSEAALAARDALHVEQLAAERAIWVSEQGAALADGLARARAEIEDALAEGTAAVLERFLGEAARVATIADLRQAIADLVLSGTGASIAIAGPADLVEGLRGALASGDVDAGRVVFSETGGVEVTVTADATTIETRLAAWARTLQRRLGDLE